MSAIRRCSIHHTGLLDMSVVGCRPVGGHTDLWCTAGDPHEVLAWEVWDEGRDRLVAVATAERILILSPDLREFTLTFGRQIAQPASGALTPKYRAATMDRPNPYGPLSE